MLAMDVYYFGNVDLLGMLDSFLFLGRVYFNFVYLIVSIKAGRGDLLFYVIKLLDSRGGFFEIAADVGGERNCWYLNGLVLDFRELCTIFSLLNGC